VNIIIIIIIIIIVVVVIIIRKLTLIFHKITERRVWSAVKDLRCSFLLQFFAECASKRI